MHELDTVRGIAILLVVFFHGFGFEFGTTGLSGLPKLFVLATLPGWMGVNLFFVLSGFLITGILLDSRGTAQFFKTFYVRRALRILPAYYLLLLVLWIVPRIGIVDHRQISWQFIAVSLLFLSNVANLFGVPMQYGPLWSLAVEEHFYLLWPAAVRFVSLRALAGLALGIFVGCPLLRAIAFELKYEYGNPYTWLVADGLAAGALLAIYCRWPGVARTHVRRLSLLCMGFALLLLATGLPFGILRAGTLLGAGSLRITVLHLFFTGTLGAALLLGSSQWRWLVQIPVLQFFGEISYGLYLIHMLVFDIVDHFTVQYFPSISGAAVRGHFGSMAARFVIAGGISVGIAWISRRTFEARFLDLKHLWAATASDPSPVQPPRSENLRAS